MRIFNFVYKCSRKYRGGAALLRLLYACDVPKSAHIADTVFFPHHALGVVIAPSAVIEDNATIQHHVTLGMKQLKNDAPRVGRGAYIGAYAIILGNVHIGENAVIGAGAIVTKDIPANTTYVNDIKLRKIKIDESISNP